MTIYGEIYKLCAAIVKNTQPADAVQMKKHTQHMEKALELIYYHYNEELSIEHVAAVTGYGKSVFCKNFKKLTGLGFHAFLNNYRINTACYLLTETQQTIDEIATMVGFKDSKSFSRVFKDITSTPPGQYRKIVKQS
jgi:AraC-like DNA-binding protein